MALGKGLGAILDEVGRAYEKEIDLESSPQKIKEVKEIDLDKITPNPYQPRKRFDKDALIELSESIKRHGLLQPIVVIQKGQNYLLVAGERRLKAHKMAGFTTIKAIVADVEIDDIRLRELALIENIQRENLNAIELAYSYDELIRVYKITHDELSIVLNKSRSQITNTIRLLSLCKYVQQKLIDGDISQGHAKVLVGFTEAEQIELANMVIDKGLSVREIELLAKSKKDKDKSSKKKRVSILAYKDNISKKLPFKFTIKRDKLEIKFKSADEIKSFLEMLK